MRAMTNGKSRTVSEGNLSRPTQRSFAGVFATAIVLLLASATFAQVPLAPVPLDEVISRALINNCAALGGVGGAGGNYGPNLALHCVLAGGSTSGAPASSGGSITVGTRLGLPDEERRIMLRLKDRRQEEQQPRASAASADATSQLRGASVFVAGEFEAFEKDITRFEPGYRSKTGGGTLGADYAFTNWMVAGAAFNYSHVEGNISRSIGGFETDSYGGVVYAGVVPARGFFIDSVLGYARKDYSMEREIAYATNTITVGSPRTRNGIAAGETSGDQFTVGVNAGYDFTLRNLTIGPRVGLNYILTTVNGFTERGRRASGCDPFVGCRSLPATGLELTYERQEETSLTSVAGVFASLAISTRFGVIIPQTTFEYVHEFDDDQRSIRFRFAEDLNRTKLRFNNDRPDRDYFHASVGLVFALPSGFSPFINYRTLLGYKDYTSHTVTGGLRFSF